MKQYDLHDLISCEVAYDTFATAMLIKSSPNNHQSTIRSSATCEDQRIYLSAVVGCSRHAEERMLLK